MDKLVETSKERFQNPEAYSRDQWIESKAKNLPEGSRVLDAGAGASKYRPYFSHCQYETQDFCQYEGDLVEYLDPVDYVCDITSVPVPDAEFDCVLCTEVLEHVVDPVAVVREFERLLKPGGILLLTSPQASLVHMEPYHYCAGFSHYWYRHWLPMIGFEVLSVTSQCGPGRVAVYGLNQFYAAWRRWEQDQVFLKRRVFGILRLLILKFPAHYLFPYLATWFDERLPGEACGIGLMVDAMKNVGSNSGEPNEES